MDLHTHLEALPPVTVLYTDLDGTLLGADGSVLADAAGRPSLAAVTAVVRAQDAGVAVVAVSGRRASQLATDVRLLGLDGAIAEAGSVRFVDGKMRMSWGEVPEDLGATPRDAIENAGGLRVVLEAFPSSIRPYQPWDEGRVGGFLLHGLIDVPRANALLVEAGIDWAHVVDNGATGGWPEMPGVRAYHLIGVGVGKAAGVAQDLRDRGVGSASAMAIGDSAEDATMATAVGTYVAVGNGHAPDGPGCFTVPGHNGEGVGQAVSAALAGRASALG